MDNSLADETRQFDKVEEFWEKITNAMIVDDKTVGNTCYKNYQLLQMSVTPAEAILVKITTIYERIEHNPYLNKNYY